MKGGLKKGGRWVDHPFEGWFLQGWIKKGWTMGGPPFRMVIHSRMDSFLFVKTFIELFWGFGHLGFWFVEVDSIILLQRQ